MYGDRRTNKLTQKTQLTCLGYGHFDLVVDAYDRLDRADCGTRQVLDSAERVGLSRLLCLSLLIRHLKHTIEAINLNLSLTIQETML